MAAAAGACGRGRGGSVGVRHRRHCGPGGRAGPGPRAGPAGAGPAGAGLHRGPGRGRLPQRRRGHRGDHGAAGLRRHRDARVPGRVRQAPAGGPLRLRRAGRRAAGRPRARRRHPDLPGAADQGGALPADAGRLPRRLPAPARDGRGRGQERLGVPAPHRLRPDPRQPDDQLRRRARLPDRRAVAARRSQRPDRADPGPRPAPRVRAVAGGRAAGPAAAAGAARAGRRAGPGALPDGDRRHGRGR